MNKTPVWLVAAGIGCLVGGLFGLFSDKKDNKLNETEIAKSPIPDNNTNGVEIEPEINSPVGDSFINSDSDLGDVEKP